MKPLESRFKRALEAAYGQPVDWPIYWMSFLPRRPGLLSSMSVSDVFSGGSEEIFPGSAPELLAFSPKLYRHRNPKVFPSVFFQDRIVLASADEQLEWFLEGRLGEAVLVGPGVKNLLRDKVPVLEWKKWQELPEAERDEKKLLRDFGLLQARNRITELDLSRANRIRAEAEVGRPAMLVFTEVWYPGWKAFVDGKKVPLYRVNYLQRGVWLTPGNRRVELAFSPGSWRWGSAISLASWLVLAIWAIIRLFPRRPPKTNKCDSLNPEP